KKISSAGKFFLQGAEDSLASLEDLEKPPMTVSFTYDYWIDTVEVTQAEYKSITGKQPVLSSGKFGYGAGYPVYYVSWYDAILFCNAKSKLFNRDTVYSFFDCKIAPSGSVYDVTGLRIDLQKNGCRLPTEAEWEFAAKDGLNGQASEAYLNPADSQIALASAWYRVNSGGSVHAVGTLLPNSLGIHDMAGNVYEWTNDWKGPYSEKKMVDPIGAPNADLSDERVIKGGSFEHGYACLRPSRRSSTYTTTLATAAEYIGFRCAYGPIPNGGNFITADTAQVRTNTVDLVQNDLRPYAGSSKARLVFVNITGSMRTLCLVDFGRAHPFIYEFSDMQSVYVPTISPDGRFAAFCNRGEGLDGSAKIYIRSLDSLTRPAWALQADSAFIPRWWVDRSAGDTFLVYVNSGIDNKLPQWSGAQTLLQKMSGGIAVGSPRLLIPEGGAYHDGISSNGRFIVTGSSRCLMRDLTNATERQLFTFPFNGKDSAGSTQVCNVSISPDSAHPDQCMFLDFGSSIGPSSLTKSVYGIHEYLFISEFAGNTLKWYKCPAGESSWDNPEWSNVARFAVALGVNAGGDPHAVYLIDLANGVSTKLVQALALAHPFLWINGGGFQGSDQISPDSCGAYYDPPLNAYEGEFSFKMHQFWKMHDYLQAVFVGNSQVFNGIDCTKLKSAVSLNMALPGAGLFTSINILGNYVLNHCPDISFVSMGSAICWMNDTDNADNNLWGQIISVSKGWQYDANHGFWKNGLPVGFESAVAIQPYYTCCFMDSFGFSAPPCQNWGGASPSQSGPLGWTIDDSLYRSNFQALSVLAQDLAARKIHLLVINYPFNPAYKNTPYYGSGGPSWQTGEAIAEQLKSLETGHPYYHFYDAYQNGNHDFSDDEASNENHLCPAGAAKLTSRIDSLMRAILAR
ncbi:MAG TPA: TIGR02171 family protein, partial [Chitinivibrionales bacterium]